MTRVLTIAVITNLVSSAGLVLLSSIIFNRFYFNYLITLATIYFLANFLLCEGLICGGYMERKWLPRREAICMSLTWIGSIVFSNFYLREKSEGWHQALKLALFPVLVLWQWMFFSIRTDVREMFALVPVILGISIVVIEDFTPSTANLIYGSLQLLNAAAFQTWINTKAEEHGMNSLQLLHNNTLVCFLILIPFAPFIDRILAESWLFMDNFHRSFFPYAIAMALLTIILNISSFSIIVRKGPIAFQVLGCLKMVLFFIIGKLVLGNSREAIKIFAVLVALSGIFVHTYLKETHWFQHPKGYHKVGLGEFDKELDDLCESPEHSLEHDSEAGGSLH